MSKLLIADLTNEKLRRDLGGAEFTFPLLKQKSTEVFGLRFSKQVGKRHVLLEPTVHEIRVCIGELDKRPEFGEFTLDVDGEETGALGFQATAEEIETAIQTTAAGANAEVVEDSASFVVTGATGPITAKSNTLRPLTFVRVHSYEVDGETVQAIRLQRAPLAFTDQFVQRVPRGPSIERIQAGGSSDATEWPEVQQLNIPLDFAGSYQLRSADGVQKSGLLGVADGPAEIAKAINPDGITIGLATDEDGIFQVEEHPTKPAAMISFEGSMFGVGHDLLEVEVFDAPEGDFWMALKLDTAAMAEMFRDVDQIRVPIEIFADIEDEHDPNIIHKGVPIYRGQVTIDESITHDDLGTAANIAYHEPPAAKDYRPVSPQSITSGVRFFPFVIGDGNATVFAIPHNLDSPRAHPFLRENAANGKALVLGEDFSVVFGDDNQLTITLLGDYAANPPAQDGLTGTVFDLTTTSTWQEHDQVIESITGETGDLRTLLDLIFADLADLKAHIKGNRTLRTETSSSSITSVILKPVQSLYPAPRSFLRALEWPQQGTQSLADMKIDRRPSQGSLVPAVHDAVIENLPSPLPAPHADFKNNVFVNAGSAPVEIEGRGSRRTIYLQPGEFAACNGICWYRVAKRTAAETTFYPTDFDLTLIPFLPVTAAQLELKHVLEFHVAFEIALLKSTTTEASYSLEVDIGYPTKVEDPNVGFNLKDVVWQDVPLLKQPIYFGSQPRVHDFGMRIERYTEGDTEKIEATKFIYGKSGPAEGAEITSANFALRAQLGRGDVEDDTDDPRGFFAVSGLLPPPLIDTPRPAADYGIARIEKR